MGGTCVALRDDGGDVAVVMIVGIALLLALLVVERGVGGVVVELGKVYGMVAIAIAIGVIGVIVDVLEASDVIQKIVEELSRGLSGVLLLGTTKDNRTLCDGGVSEMGGGFWVEFWWSSLGGSKEKIELQEEEDCLKK